MVAPVAPCAVDPCSPADRCRRLRLLARQPRVVDSASMRNTSLLVVGLISACGPKSVSGPKPSCACLDDEAIDDTNLVAFDDAQEDPDGEQLIEIPANRPGDPIRPWATATTKTVECGKERWTVKVGTDDAAEDVPLKPKTTTIKDLSEPDAPEKKGDTRIEPVEMTVYRIDNVTLTHYNEQKDDDYHLVIEDSDENEMIIEVPHPDCMGDSPWVDLVERARAKVDAELDVTSKFKDANVPVSVIGVGFWDKKHGQKGLAPNGIELHPILDICFGTDCEF